MPVPPPVVVVTEPEYLRSEQTYREAPLQIVVAPAAEAALAEAIRASKAQHAIVGGKPYLHALYEALPRGGVLARFGVGHDGIDKARATACGLLCTNTPGVLDQSVAEFTFALITAAARHVPVMHGFMVAGEWVPREGVELHGRTLVVAGAGRIGRAVARIATHGFGMRVVGLVRSASAAAPGGDADFAALTTDLTAAFSSADFLTLHMPASPENRHYLNEERLALLPAHAWVINTARGAVVDEPALYDALHTGRLGGAALDVFEHEPYVPVDAERDLRTLPNVVLAPHVGSHTVACNRRMAQRAIANVLWGEAKDYGQMDLLNRDVLQAR